MDAGCWLAAQPINNIDPTNKIIATNFPLFIELTGIINDNYYLITFLDDKKIRNIRFMQGLNGYGAE